MNSKKGAITAAVVAVILVPMFGLWMAGNGFFVTGRSTDRSLVTGNAVYSFPYASLESTILSADVIVRARLKSIDESSSEFLPGDSNLPGHEPTLDFTFETIEYLKGDGGDELVARLHHWTPGTLNRYDTEDQAIAVAREWLDSGEGIGKRWHTVEGLVMLKSYPWDQLEVSKITADVSLYTFASPFDYPVTSLDFSVESDINKAWFPASTFGSNENALVYFTDVPHNGQPYVLSEHDLVSAHGNLRVSDYADESEYTMSLQEIESLIRDVHVELREGESNHLFKGCLMHKYQIEAWIRFDGGLEFRSIDMHFDSGMPAGTELHRGGFSGDGVNHSYPRLWASGSHSHLFKYAVHDTNDSSFDGHDTVLTQIRPMPRGKYPIFVNRQSATWQHCDYYPDAAHENLEWVMTFFAPEGTLHEAFFDPTATDGAIGFTSDGFGVLEPSDIDDLGVSIESLVWEDGKVELDVSDAAGLGRHVIDFIDLQGDAALTLSLDYSQTSIACSGNYPEFVWDIPEQPWASGGSWMIRIRETDSETMAVPSEPCAVVNQ